MRRFKLGVAVAALTFVIGSSLDSHLRRELNSKLDCYCTSATCRVVLVADDPVHSLKHPLETIDMLAAARWLD